MEARLRILESRVDRAETHRAERKPVKQTLDRRFADVHSADDENVEQAVASIDGTVGDELDL